MVNLVEIHHFSEKAQSVKKEEQRSPPTAALWGCGAWLAEGGGKRTSACPAYAADLAYGTRESRCQPSLGLALSGRDDPVVHGAFEWRAIREGNAGLAIVMSGLVLSIRTRQGDFNEAGGRCTNHN